MSDVDTAEAAEVPAAPATPAPAAPAAAAAAPAAPPAPKVAAATAEAAPAAEEKPKSYWPEDWQAKLAEHVAAGDKKSYDRELKRLKRFSDPAGIYGMARELEAKFSEGGLTKIPGKNATPEEVAAYHKSIGVPETPQGYVEKLKLSDGAVLGEIDKPNLEFFAEVAHQAGVPPEGFNAFVNGYFRLQEQQAAAMDDYDTQSYQETQAALKEELGAALPRQIRAIQSLFRDLPGGTDLDNPNSVMAQLYGARLPNGNLAGNDPAMVRALIAWNKQINPISTVTEQGETSMKNVEDELSSIRKVMREDRRTYNKDTVMQARYRELLEAQQSNQARRV